MLDQRLQILVSHEQRALLEAEAKRRRSSVGSLIREAIDARFGAVSREERVRAAEEIAAMRAAPELTPREIDEILAAEREGVVPHLGSARD